MDRKETVSYCLDALKKAGADKATCSLNMSEKKELNVEIGEMTLLRTTFNNNMGISVIKDQKKGSTSINKTDKDSIDFALNALNHVDTSLTGVVFNDLNQKNSYYSKGYYNYYQYYYSTEQES